MANVRNGWWSQDVGKTISTRMGEVTTNDKAMYSDMQNARVQTYGDTAVLTYNFAGLRRAADGKIAPSLAKSSRVYVKQGGKWMLVHANFAPLALGALSARLTGVALSPDAALFIRHNSPTNCLSAMDGKRTIAAT